MDIGGLRDQVEVLKLVACILQMVLILWCSTVFQMSALDKKEKKETSFEFSMPRQIGLLIEVIAVGYEAQIRAWLVVNQSRAGIFLQTFQFHCVNHVNRYLIFFSFLHL